MKYMGHKGKMLPILGDILLDAAKGARRVADPFCGSGTVSHFMAENLSVPIIAGDLQQFAVASANAILSRTKVARVDTSLRAWLDRAKALLLPIADQLPAALRSIAVPNALSDVEAFVRRSRAFCSLVVPKIAEPGTAWPITVAYGGHYFAADQALMFDALRCTLPRDGNFRAIASAALIDAASRCTASPGHTAQPFQPTETSAKFIVEAWTRDVWTYVVKAVRDLASRSAKVRGEARVGDFRACISLLSKGDLVFADPPYSDVHYSRFYHVLETLARGKPVEVSGVGRYPAPEDRPVSEFSRRSEAVSGAQALLRSCAQRKANLVLTFPSVGASNGLEIEHFLEFGARYFRSIEQLEVDSTFSALGNKTLSGSGRKACKESIVCFRN